MKSHEQTTKARSVCVICSMYRKNESLITSMVDTDVIASLVEALERDNCPTVQYETLGSLNNIAFGTREHTVAVINCGAIPKIINILAYEDDLTELAEGAILTLGTFALHGAEARRSMLEHGAVTAMLPYLRTDTPVRRLRTCVRALSNLCSCNDDNDDDDDDTSLELVLSALSCIYDILDIENEESLDVDDKEIPFITRDILVDACTALTNIMQGPDECIEAVQAVPGLTARLVALLGHEASAVRGAALSAVGNMLAGTDAQTDRCLDANFLHHIMDFFQSSNTSLVKEAARATGNIFAGTHTQIQRALEKGVLAALEMILADKDFECQMEAARAVSKLCVNGTAAMCGRVVSGALPPYCALLAAPAPARAAGPLLQGLRALLQAAERDGNVKLLCYMLDELDVLEHMQQLKEHITDETDRCKLENMRETICKHAREERSIVHDETVFTSEAIVEGLQSPLQETQARATRALYCMLLEQYPPTNALLAAGLLAPLVASLDRNSCSKLLNVAACAFYEITAGTRRRQMLVINSGAIPKLLALLAKGDKVAELVACSLGNMSQEPEIRGAVLACVQSEAALSELRSYVRSYGELCRLGKPGKLNAAELALPFVSLLLDIGDQEILEQACLAFSNRTSVSTRSSKFANWLGIEAVQAVPGLTARLVALLGHEASDVRGAALNVLTDMLAGTNTQADRCLEAGCLEHVASLMRCSEPRLVRCAIAVAGNILGHTQSHVQQVLEMDILSALQNLLVEGTEDCQKIATAAVANICISGSAAHRARVMSRDVLEPYCALLAAPDPFVADMVLTGLYHLLSSLQASEEIEKLKLLCIKLDKMGVLDELLKMQEKELEWDLSHKAVRVSVTLRQQARGEHLAIVYGKVFTLADIVQALKSQDLETQTLGAHTALRILDDEEPPRTAMLQAGIVEPLVAALDKHDCVHFQCVAATAIVIIVHGTHKHRVAFVNGGVIPKLIAILSHVSEAVELAAQILSVISVRAPATCDLLLSNGVMRALRLHFRRDTPIGLLKWCMKIYSNLCLHITSRSIFKLVSPALPNLYELLKIEDKDVLQIACNAINNLMLYPDEHKEVVQAVPGLAARLVALLGHEASSVKEAAIGAVVNMLGGTPAQNDHCLEAGCQDYIVPILLSGEPSLVEKAVAAVTNMLRYRCGEWALENDIHSLLLKILADAEPNSFLEYYVVGALANFTAFTQEHQMAIVKSGITPNLVAIVSHRECVAEQAVRTLGNMASAGPEARDLVLAHGAVRAMLPHMRADAPRDLLRRCMQAYFSFCTTAVSMTLIEHVSPALPLVSDLLCIEDENVLSNACAMLGNLMRGSDERKEVIQAVPGLTARLVALLGRGTTRVKERAMNAVEIMLCGTDAQISRCLDAGCLEHLVPLLQRSEPSLLHGAVKTSVNVFGYSQLHEHQVRVIIDLLLNILANSEPNSSLQYDTVSAFSNLTLAGTAELRMAVTNDGAISKMVTVLAHGDKVAKLAVCILGRISEVGPEARDLVLAHGAMRAMLPHMRADAPRDLLFTCLIAYNTFCSQMVQNPRETLDLISPALHHISKILEIGEKYILLCACDAIVELTKTNEGCEAVHAVPGLAARLVALLGHEASDVKAAALNVATILLLYADTLVESYTNNRIITQWAESCLNAGYIEHIVPLLQSTDLELVERAVMTMVNILSDTRWRQQALEWGMLDRLCSILVDAEPNSSLQFYAVIAIANVSTDVTREHFMVIIDKGVIPKLVALLSGGNTTLAEVTFNALGNIATHGPEARDLVLAHGAVRAMLPHMRADAPRDLLRCMQAYRNICGHVDGIPTEKLEFVLPALPHVFKLLDIGNEHILEQACWALIGLTRTHEGCEAVCAVAGLAARLAALLGHAAPNVKRVVVVVLMLMLSGTDTQMDRCLKAGCVEHLLSYLECREPALLQRAAEAATETLGAGHPLLHRALNKHVLTPLMGILAWDLGVQNRTVKAIIKTCRRVSGSQRARLVSRGVLQPCCALLAARAGAGAARGNLLQVGTIRAIKDEI